MEPTKQDSGLLERVDDCDLFCFNCGASTKHTKILRVATGPMRGMDIQAQCRRCGAWKATTD